jgi:hypothetical protein
MMAHPFHFRLLKYKIRIKMKGDHRALLTCADRLAYRKANGLKLSETYMIRVLCEEGRPPLMLSQHTLDQLVKGIGYSDWNELLRNNPLPEGLPPNIKTKKSEQRLEALVQKCLAKRHGTQLALEFD